MNLLCGPPSNLCVSAFNGHFNAEAAKIRKAPQNESNLRLFVQSPGNGSNSIRRVHSHANDSVRYGRTRLVRKAAGVSA